MRNINFNKQRGPSCSNVLVVCGCVIWPPPVSAILSRVTMSSRLFVCRKVVMLSEEGRRRGTSKRARQRQESWEGRTERRKLEAGGNSTPINDNSGAVVVVRCTVSELIQADWYCSRSADDWVPLVGGDSYFCGGTAQQWTSRRRTILTTSTGTS